MKASIFIVCLALCAGSALRAQVYTLGDTVVAKGYLEDAKLLIDSARYDAALVKLDSAGRIYSETVGVEGLYYANVLDQYGRCYRNSGNYELSEKYYQKTIEIREKCLPTGHRLIALTYHNYGYLLRLFKILCQVKKSKNFSPNLHRQS